MERVPGTSERTAASDGKGGVCFFDFRVVDVYALESQIPSI
jgi:hypothetical protein